MMIPSDSLHFLFYFCRRVCGGQAVPQDQLPTGRAGAAPGGDRGVRSQGIHNYFVPCKTLLPSDCT